MGYMFAITSAFNQPLSFDTSSVTDMEMMFRRAYAFNQSLSFDTSSVTTFRYTFAEANSLSDANKMLIRCAWAGNSFFNSWYGPDGNMVWPLSERWPSDPC